MGNTFCFMVLLLLFPESGQSSTIACTSRAEELSYERSVLAENTIANFTYQLKSMADIEKSDYRIEIKLCDIGTLYESCRCRWFLNSDPVCRSMKNDSFCDADESEMRVSLLIRRTYTDVLWVLLQQSSPPSVLKHTTVQVTYQAKITDLHVNGQEANGTHLVDENEDVNISCFVINGNPPVSISMVDGTGHTLSSMRQGQGPLTLSLGVVHCHNVWPTIRCEAPGSELNISVVIVVKCRPQLSYISKQVTDVQKVLTEGLTFAMRSYTRNIRKCLMTQIQPITSTREVKCEVSGHVPVFKLTLSSFDETWIGEGVWTLHVVSEQGDSSITFHLINITDRLAVSHRISWNIFQVIWTHPRLTREGVSPKKINLFSQTWFTFYFTDIQLYA